MIVRLSSKGQLVIPKKIRQALNLKPGTELEVKLFEGQVVLRPVMPLDELEKTIGKLRRLAGDTSLLDELEAEHRREIERDQRREQSLPTG
jgi:AbrB family looped-hinge helix DNA binding protein